MTVNYAEKMDHTQDMDVSKNVLVLRLGQILFPSLQIVLPFPSAAKNPFFFLNFQPLKGAIIGSECSMRISFFQRMFGSCF